EGKSLSSKELREMEQSLALTERPIPRWVFPLVLFAGGTAAAAPALVKGTSDGDRQGVMLFSSIMLIGAVSGVATALTTQGTGYPAYVEALRKVRLAPLGPNGTAGVSLSGVF
ncbi:hypothetical protein ACFL5O_10380, partial [Myxococcota bacterium]